MQLFHWTSQMQLLILSRFFKNYSNIMLCDCKMTNISIGKYYVTKISEFLMDLGILNSN